MTEKKHTNDSVFNHPYVDSFSPKNHPFYPFHEDLHGQFGPQKIHILLLMVMLCSMAKNHTGWCPQL